MLEPGVINVTIDGAELEFIDRVVSCSSSRSTPRSAAEAARSESRSYRLTYGEFSS